MSKLPVLDCDRTSPDHNIGSSSVRNVLHSSASKEHYTPPEIIEAARLTMQSIDLDPASCQLANTIVKASRYYSVADDGLNQDWDFNRFPSKVFLNPPGGKTGNLSTQALWWDKLVYEYRIGRVQQAIFVGFSLEILSKRPDVLDYPCCIVNSWASADCVSGSGRLKFLKEVEGQLVEGGSPTHGSLIVHLPGWNTTERFEEYFCQFGRIAITKELQFSFQEVS